MAIKNPFRSLFMATLALGAAPFAALSQQQVETVPTENAEAARPVVEQVEARPSVVESFDEGDPELMLGGQIDLNNDQSPWVVFVRDGRLVMENRNKPDSLQFNDIAWVKFPDSDVLATTDDVRISALVEAQNAGKGGVGILVGSGMVGKYLMFSVGSDSRYYVLRKDGRKLRMLHTAEHEAVRPDAPNTLTFTIRDGDVVFYANGSEVIKIPEVLSAPNAGRSTGLGGIGLAAFGLGTFLFDRVEITRAN